MELAGLGAASPHFAAGTPTKATEVHVAPTDFEPPPIKFTHFSYFSVRSFFYASRCLRWAFARPSSQTQNTGAAVVLPGYSVYPGKCGNKSPDFAT